MTNGGALGQYKRIDTKVAIKQPICSSSPFTYQYPTDTDALAAVCNNIMRTANLTRKGFNSDLANSASRACFTVYCW